MQQRRSRFGPRVVDAWVIAVVALPGIIEFLILTRAGGGALEGIGQPPLVNVLLGVVLTLVNAAALWWRRSRPLLVLAITLAVLVVAQVVARPYAGSFVVPYAAGYAVAAYGSRRTAIAGLAGVVVASALDFVVTNLANAGPTVVTPTAVLMVASWGIGRYVRVRRSYLDTLTAYTRQLEVDRDEKARRAVLEERRRIARELHDQVAHDLGIAALHTSAARRWLERDAERAAAAMESAETAVREALTTMPAILQALRVDEAASDLAPQPMLDNLDDVVAQVSGAGLKVDLRVEGERRRLDPAVELAAYRVVQEALTNTLKHANASGATVLLRFGADQLEVEVTDDGSGGSAVGDGSGLGLIGMKERVDVLRGTLVASPHDGGGFTVRATLPLARRERASGSEPAGGDQRERASGKGHGDDQGAAGR
jgi:signal transduction histidine kinase